MIPVKAPEFPVVAANGLGHVDDLLTALRAAKGYLLNAKIDLETGAKKATAINTIDGGLRTVEAAIAKAEGRS